MTKIPNNLSDDYRDGICNTLRIMEEHRKDNWGLNDFEIGDSLGSGQFGRVYLAREKKTNYMIALKTLYKVQLLDCGVEKQALREIEIQSHLQHPHILKLFTHFHDEKKIYLVLEYAAKGQLYDYLKEQPEQRFSEHLSAKYVYQVADALDYCHKNDVIHRDLKPENLLLDYNGDIKLADFGWSVHSPSARLNKTMCGTLDYLPPEIVDGQAYDFYVDHWCLGILCYEFLVGDPPFHSNSKQKTIKKIKSVEFIWPIQITSGAKDLISKLIKKQSGERIPLPAVKKHPWILANKD